MNACIDAAEGSVSFAKRGLFGGIVSSDTDNSSAVAGNSEVIEVKTTTLERVLIDADAPREIDYLSIDVEGAEQRVLGQFNFDKYRFKCMTIERPSEVLRELLRKHEYVLIKEIPGLDCFYLHRSTLTEYPDNIRRFYRKRRLSCPWL